MDRLCLTILFLGAALSGISQNISSDYFGLKGDGKTDNSANFKKLETWLKKTPGATVSFKKGIYLAAGRSGNKTKFNNNMAPIINLEKCSNITLKGNGATIRYLGGYKFGSFDPKTGTVANVKLPFYDRSYISDLGEVFYINNSRNINISDFILDGNITKMKIGGKWGDRGYQLAHRGINIYNSFDITLANLEIKNFGLDGISIHNDYKRESRRNTDGIYLTNIVCRYNGRQGMSWTSGKGLQILNSEFSFTGKGKIQSNPGAGLDIEPEGGNFCDNAQIRNSRFEYNTGAGFVTDFGDHASDITFKGCIFTSPDQFVVWPNGKNILFDKCIFNGALIPGGRANTTNVRFTNSTINDLADKDNIAAPSGYIIEGGGGQKNYSFENCNINVKYRRLAFIEPYIEDRRLSPNFTNNSIYIDQKYNIVAPFAIIRRSFFNGNRIYYKGSAMNTKEASIVFENLLN